MNYTSFFLTIVYLDYWYELLYLIVHQYTEWRQRNFDATLVGLY